MSTDEQRLLGFPIFALAFVAVLTLVVRLARLHVRGRLKYSRGIGLTAVFVGLLLLLWWILTRGAIGERGHVGKDSENSGPFRVLSGRR